MSANACLHIRDTATVRGQCGEPVQATTNRGPRWISRDRAATCTTAAALGCSSNNQAIRTHIEPALTPRSTAQAVRDLLYQPRCHVQIPLY